MGCGSSIDTQEDFEIRSQGFVTHNAAKLESVYQLGDVLGTGAFGQVLKCFLRTTGECRAVKEQAKSAGEESRKELMNEMGIVRSLDHPNILKMYEFFEDKTRFYIVTEMCTGGELFDTIIEREHLKEKEAAILIRQALACISYCHSMNVVHRDLKPENILLETSISFDDIKIIDFGCAARWKEGQAPMRDIIGTPYYIAPEVMARSYGFKCDVWSIGVITYILLCGSPPFSGDDDDEIIQRIQSGEPPSFEEDAWTHMSTECKEFVSLLLTHNPRMRPSADKCLEHPWILMAAHEMAEGLDTNVAEHALSNLKNFSADTQLKKATYAFMAAQLISKKEREEIDKVFRSLDEKGSGKLTKVMIKDGYKNYFGKLITDEEVDKVFQRVDIDHSGFIDYSEFVVAAIDRKIMTDIDRLQAVFNSFDKDSGGTISKSEIRQIFSFGSKNQINSRLVDDIMLEVDENNDSSIDFTEFVKMMTDISNTG